MFRPGCEWSACLDRALGLAVWALGHSTGTAGGDTDLKAIQFVSEWLARNRIHFDDSAEMDRLERFGVMAQDCDHPPAGFGACSRACWSGPWQMPTSTGPRRFGAWPTRGCWRFRRGRA